MTQERILKAECISSSVKRMNSLLRINQSYDFMMSAIKDASDDDLSEVGDEFEPEL